MHALYFLKDPIIMCTKKSLFIIFIWTISVITLNAQELAAPTLKELIEAAIENDFGLKNKQLDIEALKENEQELKDLFLPTIDMTVKNGYGIDEVFLQLPSVGYENNTLMLGHETYRLGLKSDMLQAKLNAEVLLYTGGKVKALQRALKAKKQSNIELLEKDKQDIASVIFAAYDQIALLDQVEKVLQESERRLNENRRTADKALEYGLSTKYEYQKIEVAQALLNSKKLEYQGKKELLIEQLYLLTNIEKDRLRMIHHNLTPLEATLMNGKIEDRAEIKALDAGMEATQYKIKAEKTWMIPKVKAATSLQYLGIFGSEFTGARLDHDVNEIYKISKNNRPIHLFPLFNIGVGMQWTIFDGKKGSAAVKLAKIDMEKLENDKAKALQLLTLNLSNTQNNYSVSLAQVRLKEEQKVTTHNALNQATQEYRLGLIKSLQLIDAENDVQNADLDYLQSVFQQRRATAELLKATGLLTIENLEKITYEK